MRKPIAVFLALAVSGWAPRSPRLPTSQAPTGTGSADWSAVVALPRGEFVIVTLDAGEIRRGTIVSVTRTGLTIWDDDGQSSLPCGAIERVAQRVQIGTKRAPRYVAGAILAATVGGFVGIIASYKNVAVKVVSAVMLLGGAAAAGHLEKTDVPRPVFEDRLVYVRP
jgi:hypothetical protein